MRTAALAVVGLCALLGACRSATPPAETAGSAAASGQKSVALMRMEPIAIAAYRCWYGARNAAFRNTSFANELDSHSGRPRFLIVPQNDYGGRPLLVVQASGPRGEIERFGPLLSEPYGSHISGDIDRWARGDTSCAPTA